MTVSYSVNDDTWIQLTSAVGITPTALKTSEIVLFKFGNNEATLPRMKLDRYEMSNPDYAPITSGLELISGTDDSIITWDSKPSKIYQVQWSTDLVSWLPAANHLPATPPTNTEYLKGFSSGPKGFFRIGEQDADPPTGHQSYSFDATPTEIVTIHLQE